MKVPWPTGDCCAKKKTKIICKDTDHIKNWNGVNKIQDRQVTATERCVQVRVKMSLYTPLGHIKAVEVSALNPGERGLGIR
jgi:hypothetical protein